MSDAQLIIAIAPVIGAVLVACLLASAFLNNGRAQ